MAVKLPTANADQMSSAVMIPSIVLLDLVECPRARKMQRRESYYRCTQHDAKQYDWDGFIRAWGEDAIDIPSVDFIPMRRRRPSARVDMAKIIVESLTSMVFGLSRFPTIKVVGDEDAEDFANQLAKESSLSVRMIEARNLGGACGTIVLSWGFVDGRPEVEVHQAGYINVLEWKNWEKRIPAKVIKVYEYDRTTWVNGRPKEVPFYHVRYWDEEVDITWPAVTREQAQTRGGWVTAENEPVYHGSGFCPVYWVQNIPDSSSADGFSDFENQEINFDSLDYVKSSTVKGVVANVDPTVVIHDDPHKNQGLIRLGSGHAIYSRHGAKFLELAGSAVEAGRNVLRDMKQDEYDKSSVVVLDPEKLSGAGVSAASLRLRFSRMIVKTDQLRETYGEAIKNILTDMLKVAQQLPSRGVIDQKNDSVYWEQVTLEPRVIENEEDNSYTVKERTPGTTSNVAVSWPAYFPDTWEDRSKAVNTTRTATGNQSVLSRRTALENIAAMFGIDDIYSEVKRIEEDAKRRIEETRESLEAGAPKIDTQGQGAGRKPQNESKNRKPTQKTKE